MYLTCSPRAKRTRRRRGRELVARPSSLVAGSWFLVPGSEFPVPSCQSLLLEARHQHPLDLDAVYFGHRHAKAVALYLLPFLGDVTQGAEHEAGHRLIVALGDVEA